MDFKSAIEEAKKLIKHLEENPAELEKLNKATSPLQQNALHRKTSPKGVHQAVDPKGGSTAHGEAAKLGMKDTSKVWAKEAHGQVRSEQKAMPKPNLPKSEMQKGDYFKSKLGKVSSHQPTRTGPDKVHAAGGGGIHGKHDVKGVHRDRLNQRAGSHEKSRLGILQDKANADVPAHKDAWKEQHLIPEHKAVIAEQKAMPKPNLPKSEMQKSAKDMCKEEWAPKFHKSAEKGVHQSVNAKGGASEAGDRARSAERGKPHGWVESSYSHKQQAKEAHGKVIAEQKAMPKPNLPKSELNKARIDDGKSLAHKVALRQNRNSRDVKETRTPTGQKNRTMSASNKRAGELETKYRLQTPVGNFNHVPERRHGEKIVGAPKRSDEDKSGVHHHSNTFAQGQMKNKAVDGHGTFSEKGGKSHRLGGKYHAPGGAHTAHNDIMNAQSRIKPNLPKSEFKKDELETGLDVIRDANVETSKKMREMLNDTAVQAGKIAEKFASGKGTLKAAIGTKNQAEEEKKEFNEAVTKAEVGDKLPNGLVLLKKPTKGKKGSKIPPPPKDETPKKEKK
jgi:hypothetical protein